MAQRDGSKKQELILQTAETLYKQHGIRRVPVEEICRRAGVSKATFYKYFANREVLAVAVLDRMVAPLRARIETEVFGAEPFIERLQTMQRIQREGLQLWGQELMRELIEQPLPAISRWIDRERQVSVDTAMRFFREGQLSGVLNQAFPPEFFLLLLDFIEKIFYEERVKALFPDLIDRSEMLNAFLQFGIMTPSQAAEA